MNQPQPVLINGTITAFSGALLPILIGAGVQADTAGRVAYIAGATVAGVLGLIALLRARAAVTPLASPRSATGVPLVEAPTAVSSTGTAGSPAPTTPGGTP